VISTFSTFFAIIQNKGWNAEKNCPVIEERVMMYSTGHVCLKRLVHKQEQKSERRKRLQTVVFIEIEKNWLRDSCGFAG
jgi:hypothetical protein